MPNREIDLKINPGYLIFFDSIRVDQFVESWSTQISSTGQYGQATITMRYIPDLDKITHYDNSNAIIKYNIVQYDEQVKQLFYIDDGVENMTNVRIFMKNVFTEKYTSVFEGNIRSKSSSINSGGRVLTFVAYDYTNSLNRILCPWSISFEKNSNNLNPPLIWSAHGVDTERAMKNIQTQNDTSFNGESLKDSISKCIKTAYSNNAFLREYSENKLDTNNVMIWDKSLSRLILHGDISDRLRKNQAWKYTIDTNATHVDSFYMKLQQILSSLLFENYQDRDGLIRIKPYFWNQDVVKNMVIDSSLILNYNEDVNWNNLYTRVITTGGAYIDQKDGGYVSTEGALNLYSDYITPVAVSTWAGNVVSRDVMTNKVRTPFVNAVEEILKNKGLMNTGSTLTDSGIVNNNSVKVDVSSLKKAGDFKITAYDLSIQSCDKSMSDPAYGITASGKNIKGLNREQAMCVAAPDSFKLNSKLYLKFSGEYTSYSGIYTVYDRGGAITGNKIDLFLGDFNKEQPAQECYNFGIRPAEVYYLTDKDIERFSGKNTTSQNGSIGLAVNGIASSIKNNSNLKGSVNKNSANALVSAAAYGMPFDNKFTMTSGYGPRNGSFHWGIDICGSTNINVRAIQSGTIQYVQKWNGDTNDMQSYGNMIYMYHPITRTYSRYAHLSKVLVYAGQQVNKGDIIGVEGNTGRSYGSHLHLEILTSDNQSDRIDPRGPMGLSSILADDWSTFDPSSDTVGQFIFNNQLGDISEPVFSYNSDEVKSVLLKMTELEKRYGPLVHNTEQNLINFSNSLDVFGDGTNEDGGTVTSKNIRTQSAAFEALCQYGKFTLNKMNSMSNTVSLSCIPMPWVRPGQNAWIDPAGIDKVFYITTVAHQGTPASCSTSLYGTMGRASYLFLNGELAIGARKAGNETDDVFINKISYDGSSCFGTKLKTEGEVSYDNIKRTLKDFHTSSSQEPEQIIVSSSEKGILNDLYDSSTIPSENDKIIHYHSSAEFTDDNGNVVNTSELVYPVFSGEYSVSVIEDELKSYYESAPNVVKSRNNRLKSIINNSISMSKYLYSE